MKKEYKIKQIIHKTGCKKCYYQTDLILLDKGKSVLVVVTITITPGINSKGGGKTAHCLYKVFKPKDLGFGEIGGGHKN